MLMQWKEMFGSGWMEGIAVPGCGCGAPLPLSGTVNSARLVLGCALAEEAAPGVQV